MYAPLSQARGGKAVWVGPGGLPWVGDLQGSGSKVTIRWEAEGFCPTSGWHKAVGPVAAQEHLVR